MHAQFAVHILNEEGKRKAQEIAHSFDDLLTRLEAICPEGRHLALVRTKLEEACFFAKKAMAFAKKAMAEVNSETVRPPQPSPDHRWDGALDRWYLPGETLPAADPADIVLGHVRHG